MTKATVLFLCTGNSARSQIAEALLRKHAADQFDVFSAGLRPEPINPLTNRVLEEIGIDIRDHRSKPVGEFLGKVAITHVIFVCHEVEIACPTTYPFALQKHSWPFDDPAAVEGTEEERLEAFRDIRDQIDERIREWIGKED